MANPEFNLSDQIQHNRELAEKGTISADMANQINNWLMKVSGIAQSAGKSFAEIAASVPSPVPWTAYTSQEGGSEVTPPTVSKVGANGTELVDF